MLSSCFDKLTHLPMGILQIKGIKLITEHQGTGKVTELEKVHDAGVFFFPNMQLYIDEHNFQSDRWTRLALCKTIPATLFPLEVKISTQ